MTAKSKIDRATPLEDFVPRDGNDRTLRAGTEIQSDRNGETTEAAIDTPIESGEQNLPPVPDENGEAAGVSVPTLPDATDEVSLHTSSTLPSEPSAPSASTADTRNITDTDPTRRTVKQRKSDLDEYRRRYMQTPRIEDRKPVFVSRRTRDRLDRIVRLLGERGMSVSGLIENIALHHLAVHEADVEHWRKL